MKKGYLNIVLHAHLPYVRHPEYDSFFEENWLFEAMTECYIPLIQVLDRLQNDMVDYCLTLSLSPTLMAMLQDDLLQSRYLHYLQQRIELAEKEIVRTCKQPEIQKLARLYRRFFLNTLETYQEHYHCDLLAAFKKHYYRGSIELITTAATHAFLPLLNVNKTAVVQQVKIGIDAFKSTMGFSPLGFWLPECAYYSGVEQLLDDLDIRYFYTDSHAVLDASIKPSNGVYAPLDCGNGVLAFARDPDSSRQVWSAEEGYPGNEHYREYYSDIGFELELEAIRPYILKDETRINTGIKYHHITREGMDKQLFDPRLARRQVNEDARDFIEKCQRHVNHLAEGMDNPPIIVAPYDAELFGHWWFEGPCWLEQVLRLAAENCNAIETVSCKRYIELHRSHQVSKPAFSSWGDQGYSNHWINEENDWIYPFLHKAADEMEQLIRDFSGKRVTPLQQRALNQALRSLLLAQASDWPFILKSGTTVEYAKKRITDYLARFNYLHQCIRKNRVDEHYLRALEIMDNIFPDIDYSDFEQET